jgi:lytic murein transglycosylase
MNRRALLAIALASVAIPPVALASPQPADLLGAAGDPAFLAWLNEFYGRMAADGWPPALLSQLLTGLTPDPRVLMSNAGQPEFATPISAYVRSRVTDSAAALGRRKRDGVPGFEAIGHGYGVPPDILTAIWAMETGYGSFMGDMDVVRSLATLAAEDARRHAWAEEQLVACLKLLRQGWATRAQLRGSWAGAMGQTQMEPATFVTTAVSASGSGRPDIWNSSADALASAANLLAKAGWQRGQSWAVEVTLQHRFDVGLSEGPKQAPAWWADKGAVRADGGKWREGDGAAEAQLILPAGAAGPAFLVLPNHFVIRTYNNSLAYALSVGLLADRIGGAGPLVTPWPHETPLSLSQRMDAQTALAKLGYNVGAPDGFIGLATRQALRAWQRDHHLPADGYLTPGLVAQLQTSARG